ncbi:MAG: DMT family transporter [Desulfobacterales bacterium]|nr:DMT family transporter [Desulfobacterales bacterium]
MEPRSSSGRMIQVDARMAGPLFMLSAALLFTLMSTIVKLMPEAYTIWHLGFIRCFGGLVVLTTLFSRGKNPLKGHNYPLLILRGCFGALAFFCVVTAVRTLPISTAVVLFYTFPVFAALFGFLIYRETLNQFQMVCIGVLVAGVAVLFDFSFTGDTFGQAMAIAAAVIAGVTVTLIRSLREKNGPVVIYFYFCLMGTLATLPLCLASPYLPASPAEWAMILGIVATSVAAQLLMNQGFFFCKGFEGAAYMSCETVFTVIVGIVFLNDPVSWHFFLGGVLIVGSGLSLHWLGRHKSA